jgi:hypothetical protein
LSPNALKLSQQDLNKMLNDARRMAESGSRESARQMLDRLQQMLENLQAGVPTQMGKEGSQAQEMMNDLGRMMQRQQDLLQQSFQQQRGQQSGNQSGEQSGEGQPGEGDGSGATMGAGNGAGQEQLRQDFGSLMRRFSNMMGDLPQGMGQAEQSMREAVDALRKPDFGGAADAQNQALKQMQQSLQSMKDMIQRQAGNSQGPGKRDQMDPFGHPNPSEDEPGGNSMDLGNNVKVPKESDLQRARQIFDELRQRRNDPNRPKDEREYLDRLLKQF